MSFQVKTIIAGLAIESAARRQQASSLFLAFGCLLWSAALCGADQPAADHALLARYWAPVLVQSTEYNFRSDVITRIDFDGNYVGSDNLANTDGGYDLPSAAYYHVHHSGGHYYITYSFYHVAAILDDGSGEEQAPYEHDLQSVVVAIAQDEGPTGRFVAIAAVDHPEPIIGAELSPPPAGEIAAEWQARVSAGVASASDVDFVVDSLGVHPVLYGDAGSHRLQLEKRRSTIPSGPIGFEEETVTDWRHIATVAEGGGAELKSRYHRPGNGEISGTRADRGVPPDDGLIYRAEATAMPVIEASSKGRGTIVHHWNLIAYELLSLPGLIALQGTAEGKSLFDGARSLATDNAVGATNRLPWQADWFRDPAALFTVHATTTAGAAAGK